VIVKTRRRHLQAVQLGDLGDPLIWTPNSIASLRDQADGEIQATAVDVSTLRAIHGDGVVTSSALASFKAFYNEWKKYKDSIGITGLLWGSTADRINEYRTRNTDWRNQFKAAGGTLSSPTPPKSNPALPSFNDMFAGLGTVVKWGIPIAAVVLLAPYAGPLLKRFK
jgi:hypothetical protein